MEVNLMPARTFRTMKVIYQRREIIKDYIRAHPTARYGQVWRAMGKLGFRRNVVTSDLQTMKAKGEIEKVSYWEIKE